jgi:hypothetical protein
MTAANPPATLQEWMASATADPASPFSPPGLIAAVDARVVVHGVDGAGTPLRAETLFPLACVTKLALADLALRALPLDAPITTWVPEVHAPEITTRHLITHTAGLPLDLPSELYGVVDKAGVRYHTLQARPVARPGQEVAYSNLGYGWLAVAIERVYARRLKDLWADYGLISGEDLSSADGANIADIKSVHRGTAFEPVNSDYWRSLELPWAGAFGDVGSVQRLLERFLPRRHEGRTALPGGFPAGAYFGFEPTSGSRWPDAAWGLGVEWRGTKRPHWVSSYISPDSFGHVGSSGVLVWHADGSTIVLAGARTTDGGWLLRRGPKGTEMAFREAKALAIAG